MLLSIVMMVKNEEKYLDKTLSSLQSLMNDIDSELIILDTGSTDNTVDIAKKYTEKVYFSKWSNNFSDMRNISISYASGEWILVLDADEELTNYEKLKIFFESDIHHKYNSASIELKNIFTEDGGVYNLASILRLFRNEEDFKFIGSIHEQPKYKVPIYNDIASFIHYGYMFKDESIRQLKIKRNGEILLNQIDKTPNDAYTNYQLGKNYLISSKKHDAIFYIEKAYALYNKRGRVPIYVTSDLIKLYIDTNSFTKSEKMCLDYIKYDKNNIDIYYYLGEIQRKIGKYKDSIKSYEKYLYLLENYNISTQSKNIDCNCDTKLYKNRCEIIIIGLYYNLENYEEVIKRVSKLSVKYIKSIYYTIISSLYKLNKINEIKELYNKISENKSERNKFFNELEKVLREARFEYKEKLYEVFSNIDDNYGVLNKIRITGKIDVKKCNDVLKNENNMFYGDIVHYAFKANVLFENILKDVSYTKTESYFAYLITNKKESIIYFYDYLSNSINTLDLEKIKIYVCLSKSLLYYGNLDSEKYKNIFLMYILYTYNYLKFIYNPNINDEELCKFLTNKEDIFVIDIMKAQKLKNKDSLEYIKRMRQIILNNPQYKQGIEILIDNLTDDIKSNGELQNLKKEYKRIIEENLNQGNIDNSLEMIKEYESIFKDDLLLNFRAIVSIYKSEFEKADYYLKQAYIRDSNDYNVIFNIAYVKELLGENKEAQRFYFLLLNSDDSEIKIEAKNRLSEIKSKEL